MEVRRKKNRCWSLRITIFLLVLIGVGLWQYQSDSVAPNHWLWEDQLKMEVEMANAAEISPGVVPEIDRSIPPTEMALFALG